MDDKGAPAWLAVNIDRMKVADLTKLCEQLVREAYIPKVPTTTAQKQIAVRAARSKYWDMRHEGRFASRFAKRRPAFNGQITAAEVNEFLATLPPTPLWPDTCQCQNCRESA